MASTLLPQQSAPGDSTLTTCTTDSQVVPLSQVPTPPSPPSNKDRDSDSDSDSDSPFINLSPAGFHVKPPPPPHELSTFHTPTTHLFQTTHMGFAVLDHSKYTLKIDGLVTNPLTLTLAHLQSQFPPTTLTAFHECYGSPLNPPPTKALWRIGNVQWKGIALHHILDLAQPLFPQPSQETSTPTPSFIWATGLDRGTFANVPAPRYQKDLTLTKALSPEVLLAWEMNKAPLSRENGGPIRLVVPGWYGTNSVKWLERISVKASRAEGPFTTIFYNEPDPAGSEGTMRPVWEVGVNSMVVRPAAGEVVRGERVVVEGWAWGCGAVEEVRVCVVDIDDGGGEKKEKKKEDKKEEEEDEEEEEEDYTQAKASLKPSKALIDVETRCGVELTLPQKCGGGQCAKSLTCKSHSMGAKRAVPGRSATYDELLMNYQRENRAKVQKARFEANDWKVAKVEERVGFSWQRFSVVLELCVGQHTVIARARPRDGSLQPLSGTRNHCHSVDFEVV